jgi:FtsH-binding integral membrane protein
MPFDTSRQQQPPYSIRPPQAAPYQADSAERTFVAAVYRWMALGLVVTAAVAWGVASSEAAIQFVILNSWVRIGLILAQFGLVIALSAMVARLSGAAAGAMFLAYSALTGATISVVLLVYTAASVGLAFAITAGTFGAMSVYGTVTKRDLTSWSSFLFMGLIGIVIAGLVNMFLQSSAMSFVLSCAAVVVFTGLTAYDTQKIRAFAAQGGATMAAAPIAGALTLYLDFINLFLAILRLVGGRRRD